MKTIISFLMLHIITFIILSLPVYAEFYDWEDVNKSLSHLKLLFKTHQSNSLSALSDDDFAASGNYQLLSEYIDNYSINLGKAKERCIKEFPIVTGKKKGHKLFLSLIRKQNRRWFIEDAFLTGQNESERFHFPGSGFAPLAIEYNFSDVVKAVRNETIHKYSGLGPGGKLPPDFLLKNQIEKSEKAVLFIQDILIHKEQDIVDLIYLKLEYFSGSKMNKRGWLLTESGSMLSCYKKYYNDNPLTNAVNQESWQEYVKSIKYDLAQKDSYSFINIKESLLETGIDSFKITKVSTDFNWKNNVIDIYLTMHGNITELNESKITSDIKLKRLVINFDRSVTPENLKHPYFLIRFDGKNIALTLTKDTPFVFIPHYPGWHYIKRDSDKSVLVIQLKFSWNR
jgi:hypothetical protein